MNTIIIILLLKILGFFGSSFQYAPSLTVFSTSLYYDTTDIPSFSYFFVLVVEAIISPRSTS